jgi:hypothetical protein
LCSCSEDGGAANPNDDTSQTDRLSPSLLARVWDGVDQGVNTFKGAHLSLYANGRFQWDHVPEFCQDHCTFLREVGCWSGDLAALVHNPAFTIAVDGGGLVDAENPSSVLSPARQHTESYKYYIHPTGLQGSSSYGPPLGDRLVIATDPSEQTPVFIGDGGASFDGDGQRAPICKDKP